MHAVLSRPLTRHDTQARHHSLAHQTSPHCEIYRAVASTELNPCEKINLQAERRQGTAAIALSTGIPNAEPSRLPRHHAAEHRRLTPMLCDLIGFGAKALRAGSTARICR